MQPLMTTPSQCRRLPAWQLALLRAPLARAGCAMQCLHVLTSEIAQIQQHSNISWQKAEWKQV